MSEDALPQTCAPSVWVSAGHVAYLGPSLHLGPHSTAIGCFVLGLDAPFEVTRPGRPTRLARSIAVPARAVHQVLAPDGWMLFAYPDPASGRWQACHRKMRGIEERFGFEHADQDALLELASHDPRCIADVLTRAAPPTAPSIDRRIRDVVERLRADPAKHYSVHDAALAAGLSVSHFQRRFAADVGTSFRRYRLWTRMGAMLPAVAAGSDLTTAAADAGFASPSHFADAFREMFGLSASALLSTGVRILVDPR